MVLFPPFPGGKGGAKTPARQSSTARPCASLPAPAGIRSRLVGMLLRSRAFPLTPRACTPKCVSGTQAWRANFPPCSFPSPIQARSRVYPKRAALLVVADYSDLAMICAASALFTPSSGRNVPVGRPSAPLSPETTLFVAASAMSAS